MNTITFQPPKNDSGRPNVSGVSTQDVWNLISQEPIRPWRVKDILDALDMNHSEYNIKNVSNRCGYLVNDRHLVVRIDQGVYRALDEKEREMQTMEYGDAFREGDVTQPASFPRPTATNERVICPECGKSLASDIGLKAHLTRSHGNKLPQDEIFERVAAATEILFPDPKAVFARFEEIAELRKAMFRALAR